MNNKPPHPHTADHQLMLRLAATHQQAGRLDAAEDICRKLLKRNPRDVMALTMQGTLARMRGDTAQARESFLAALKVDSHFVPALGNLGDVYRQSSRYPDALKCYRKILQTDPGNLSAFLNMGQVYLVLTQFEDAIKQFQQALNIHPKLPAAYSNIGAAFMELGRLEEARASLEQALALEPTLAAAHFNMHAIVFDDKDMRSTIASLTAALAAKPDHHDARSHLGMYLDFIGNTDTAEEHFAYIETHAPHVCNRVDSWRYIRSRLELDPDIRLFAVTRHALEYAFSLAKLDGLVLEFGVRNGHSTNILARKTDQEMHGFDSFEGLPEQWEGMPVGALSTFQKLPKVPGHVHLHPGWFDETLPRFVERHAGPIRFMNVDCDIYSSTKTIFHHLQNRIVPGTVIIFDEYICNPSWREHEYKAFQEFIAESGLSYRYLLFSPFSKQAAVMITA